MKKIEILAAWLGLLIFGGMALGLTAYISISLVAGEIKSGSKYSQTIYTFSTHPFDFISSVGAHSLLAVFLWWITIRIIPMARGKSE